MLEAFVDSHETFQAQSSSFKPGTLMGQVKFNRKKHLTIEIWPKKRHFNLKYAQNKTIDNRYLIGKAIVNRKLAEKRNFKLKFAQKKTIDNRN